MPLSSLDARGDSRSELAGLQNGSKAAEMASEINSWSPEVGTAILSYSNVIMTLAGGSKPFTEFGVSLDPASVNNKSLRDATNTLRQVGLYLFRQHGILLGPTVTYDPAYHSLELNLWNLRDVANIKSSAEFPNIPSLNYDPSHPLKSLNKWVTDARPAFTENGIYNSVLYNGVRRGYLHHSVWVFAKNPDDTEVVSIPGELEDEYYSPGFCVAKTDLALPETLLYLTYVKNVLAGFNGNPKSRAIKESPEYQKAVATQKERQAAAHAQLPTYIMTTMARAEEIEKRILISHRLVTAKDFEGPNPTTGEELSSRVEAHPEVKMKIVKALKKASGNKTFRLYGDRELVGTQIVRTNAPNMHS